MACASSFSRPRPTSSTSRNACRSTRPSASFRAAPTANRRTSWSACSTGSIAPRGCATPACATSTPPAPRTERGEHHNPETHIIPLVLQVALGQREQFSIFGDDYPTPDGTCIRDYIHVIDLAQAHILALRALDGGSRTYNLGNGRGFSIQELIDVAREITGHPIPTKVVARRPGDPAILIASSEKIRRELGWQPQYPELRTHPGKRLEVARSAPARVRLLRVIDSPRAIFHTEQRSGCLCGTRFYVRTFIVKREETLMQPLPQQARQPGRVPVRCRSGLPCRPASRRFRARRSSSGPSPRG